MKKAIKKVNAFVGAMETTAIMAGLKEQSKDDKFRDEWNSMIVDTVVAFDTETWETGISINAGDKWTIVEQYEGKGKAKTGHDSWVKKLQNNPKMKLSDLDLWNLGI